MHLYRTHNCNELTKSDINKNVRLSGWVHHRRDHGGVLFIDLRDQYGITQIVFHPEDNEMLDIASHISYESVITVTGNVVERSEETVNSKLTTGEIELFVSELNIESSAKTTPFQVAESDVVNEDLRLRYRFIDLRREKMRKNIIFRAEVITTIREFM
ncbi:aspartate--tRNA ligase, partial [bacterium]|nr:aspartate--tRNA ligase [bacterium]